jgi:hypothetical protein
MMASIEPSPAAGSTLLALIGTRLVGVLRDDGFRAVLWRELAIFLKNVSPEAKAAWLRQGK